MLLSWLDNFKKRMPHPWQREQDFRSPEELPLKTIVGNRFEIDGVLGRGGFGRTYRAKHQGRFSEVVVLKEFCPDPAVIKDYTKARELFEREARILHQLDHPQIPKFLETIVEEIKGIPRFFLVQEYISGNNYRVIHSHYRQGMPEVQVQQFLKSLLSVVGYLHSQTPPILHRDISPENIILCDVTGLPKLIDFGAVK